MNSTMTALDPSITRELAGSLEPCASICLGLLPIAPSTDVSEDLGLRWRQLAERLRSSGADEVTIAAIWDHLEGQSASPARYAVFARQGQVLFGHALPGPVGPDLARFGAPADVVSILAWLQRHPAYVVVVTDRTGGDLTAVPYGGVDGAGSTVIGPDDDIERRSSGGWTQLRNWRRAEDSWHHNAGAVAGGVARALDEAGARLLLVAGDNRAVQLLREQLPAGAVVRHLPGGRRPDGSGAARQVAIDSAVAEYVASQTADLMDRLDAERRLGGVAVEGVAATLSALSEGRVRTLIVVDDPDDERTAWFGPETLCADGPVVPPEASWIAAGRLTDVAVRAALLTGADVYVVTPEESRALGEQIGGLCRFTPTAIAGSPG